VEKVFAGINQLLTTAGDVGTKSFLPGMGNLQQVFTKGYAGHLGLHAENEEVKTAPGMDYESARYYVSTFHDLLNNILVSSDSLSYDLYLNVKSSIETYINVQPPGETAS